MAEAKKDDNILKVAKAQQFKTVDELINRSRPNSIYYTFLVLSSFIIAAGLLLSNTTIVIGGMLITPVLGPVLVIALVLAVGELKSIKEFAILTLKSFAIVILSSLVLAILFQAPTQDIFQFENTIRTAALYFLIAVSAGIAATFGWARTQTAEVLPGIAIAVSLVPPLSLIGIALSSLNFEIARFSFVIFFFNYIGIILGSIIAFALMKFNKSQREIKKEVKLVEKEAKVKKRRAELKQKKEEQQSAAPPKS